MSIEILEHVADKYGFPIAVVVWMFWRDWYLIRTLATDMTRTITLLETIAKQTKTAPAAE